MARDLGFLVHDTKAQYLTLPKDADEPYLEQVRTELAARDLKRVTPTRIPRIIDLFERILPAQAHRFAARWAVVGSHFPEQYKVLRDPKTPAWDRHKLLNELLTRAEHLLTSANLPTTGKKYGGWALEEEPDEPDYEDFDWDE